MTHRKFEAYPENAPGAFYVEKDLCITCRVPELAAPDLIGLYEGPSGTNRKSHCYFKKQPTSASELERAIKAVSVSCCGAYHYAGTDVSVKEKLSVAGQAEAIDHV
jgi:hypothetical protein